MTGAATTGAACGSAQISACALAPSQSIVCRCASVVASGCFAIGDRRADRHRRAGLRRAARRGYAGLDVERIEPAGILERAQAGIAHAREEGGVGVEQAVEPVDQNARRQQIEQRAVARAVAVRGRRGLGQPFGRAGGASGSGIEGSGVISAVGGSDVTAAIVSRSRSSRSDNCRASSLNALFSTGVSVGDRCIAGRAERHDIGRRFHWCFRIGWV